MIIKLSKLDMSLGKIIFFKNNEVHLLTLGNFIFFQDNIRFFPFDNHKCLFYSHSYVSKFGYFHRVQNQDVWPR